MSPSDEREGEPEGSDRRERKERVIHARIPPGLEEDLRKLSEALRVPMSNLIRNILQDTLSAVDRVGQTMEDLMEDVSGHVGREASELRRKWARYQAEREKVDRSRRREEDPPKKPDPLMGVYGFQPLILNVATTCAVCSKDLGRGTQAHLGLTDRPGRRVFLCDSCLPEPSKE